MANNEVKLKLSVDGTQAVLSQFDRVRSGMSGISDAATTMGSVVKGMAAAFSVGAVAAWARATIDAADAMNDMSQRVGIAVKDLAKYELAASQSGTTMEALSRGIKGLAGNLAEHGAALKKAGIDTSNADTAMQGLADVFASMPDGIEKTNLAVKLFGKSGMDMIPMLNLGAEGLQTAAEKTAAYATQMAALAPLADEFNDNSAQMALQSRGVGMIMLNELMPSLVKVSEAMANADETGTSLASLFGKGLKIAFQTVALIASDVVFVFKGIGREIGGIAAQVVAAATGDWAGFSAISDAMKADAARAREELDRFQDDLVNGTKNIQSAYNKRQGFGETVKTSGSGGALLKALGADKSTTEAAKAANALLKEQIELAKWNTKAVDELFEAQEKQRLGVEDQIKNARTTLEQIEFETALLTMNTEQRALATMERELETKGIVKGTLAYDAYIEKLREAMAIKSGKEAGIKATEALADANKKAAEESSKFWEDALMRAFESGKGFFQSLWDTIKNTLKTQVLKVLVSATGLTGMSAAGAGELGGSGGGNLLGTAANLGKMYDAITGGFTGLADSVAFAANDMGAWLVNNTSGMLNQAGSALMQSAGTFGTVAGYAAGAAAGLAIGSAISGKYGSSGVVTAGTAIGAIFGGPIGGAIGGAIGGLVNRAFGRGPTELTASGTRGTFSGDSFSGSNYASYKKDGGWFRSDKNWTDVTAIDPATLSAWSSAFAGVKGSVAGMAASLGLATDKISAYSKAVDIAAGTTQEQITAIFTGMADDMATAAAPAIAAFGKSGESASVTLSRLGSSLSLVNQWLTQFNDTLLATSLTGGDQASRLLDAFGGADPYASAQSAYYQAIYTDAQRLEKTTVNVAKGLALVNIAMPTTLAAYDALRTGLDLTTDAGRNAYTVMTLLGPEFAQVADAAQSAATESVKLMNDVFDTLQGRLTSLIDSIASERDAVAGARAGIMGLAPKTAAQLAAEIAASKVALPSDAALLAALQGKSTAQGNLSAAQLATQNAQAAQNATAGAYGAAVTGAQNSLTSTVNYYKNLAAGFQRRAIDYAIHVNATGTNNDAYSYNAGTNQLNGWNDISDHTPSGRSYGHFLEDAQRFKNEQYGNGTVAALVGGNAALASAAQAVTNAQTAYNSAMAAATATTTAAQNSVTQATTALAAADATAKTALLNYAAAMTQYSGDAEKAVKVLSQLREETVNYYETQKALSGLMATSAANLRTAVQAMSVSQLGALASRQYQERDFARAYSMALSTSGATKAGYADQLAAALPALSESIKATSTLRDWAISAGKLAAQSSTIADQLDSAANAMNYEAESLSLLGSIDVALAELDTNTAILKNAIDAGTNTSAAGLRAIVTQLGGVPAFAGGGYHSGGVRIVGENGPELEVTGPSRIFNASQLRGMGGGNTSRLEALVERLTQKVEALQQSNSRENAAIATHAALTADATRRMDKNGVLIYTDPTEPINTVAA